MEEQRYRIEEESTSGWFLVNNHQGLTKDQASQVLNGLFQEGYNPERLRVIREK
jgi:hypothetical protein